MTDPQHNERIHKEPLNSAALGLFRQEREKELTHGKRGSGVMMARLDQVSGRVESESEIDRQEKEESPATVTHEEEAHDEAPREEGNCHDWYNGMIAGAIIATVIWMCMLGLRMLGLRRLLRS